MTFVREEYLDPDESPFGVPYKGLRDGVIGITDVLIGRKY